MSAKVLFVDDEPNVLDSICRNFRRDFDLSVAEGGDAALQLMENDGPFAVVVSDMRMPGMNGVELLAACKERWPDTVRMMLTGNADQKTAVDAVNHGDIFRFLNKPCDRDTMGQAVQAGVRHYQLVTAERDLLENTLRGSIKALAEVLSLTNPEVFGRTTRYKNLINMLAKRLELPDLWQLESVALLSQMGCVSVPEDLVKRKTAGHPLPDDELEEFAAHAAVGADVLAAIPRMDEIAAAVRYQEKNYDGSGFPRDDIKGEQIPKGSRLMRVIIDLDAFQTSGMSRTEALGRMKQQSVRYEPSVLDALIDVMTNESRGKKVRVSISELTDKSTLAEDVRTSEDVLLVADGQETTEPVRQHLRNFLARGLIREDIVVWVDAE